MLDKLLKYLIMVLLFNTFQFFRKQWFPTLPRGVRYFQSLKPTEKDLNLANFVYSKDWTGIGEYWKRLLRVPTSELPQFIKGETNISQPIVYDPRSNGYVFFHSDLFEMEKVNGTRNINTNGFGFANLQQLHLAGLQGDFQSKNPRYQSRPSFAIRIGYDGSAYSGFQSQGKNSSILTVEADLQRILNRSIASAGRTDRGVSALSQVVLFQTKNTNLTAEDILQTIQKSDACEKHQRLFAYDCYRVPKRFHPRLALWRRYLYLIPLNEATTDPRDERRHGLQLDIFRMNSLLSK
jgi:hypothetical protein